ncbi:MAG: glycosyltransferase [Runella slithyformis]|nr:MAG: glycosyltransferase [Runella sp.]TAG20008.1 MAG: glycosyltransferase [Cytophagales bacterium]TAG38029.1 MAG: glycosyltransferase [Cytophagia bacterium]TAG51276.1 MAG: glycosyltransferase [Runella slithyformis]TAG69999.1 MAG: glycosyltransferase [Runella slithyformis]
MFYALFALTCSYGLCCIWLAVQWQRMAQRPQLPVDLPPHLRLSVVIPVRNEAANIGALLADLEAQTLPKNQFEIIIANDASIDDTTLIVRQFQATRNLNLTLISLPETPHTAPKKRAIAAALEVATGTLIVSTDGDCRVGAQWLQNMAQTYAQTSAKFISGPVTFETNPSRWFDVFQTIEFASLIGTGACLVEAGHPTMCNGANLAFERATFDAVGGYAGTDHLASGDDELLMHKIAQQYPRQIVFLKNAAAIVKTWPQPNWRAFYGQRVRWGSKWAANGRVATMAVAFFVFLANLSLIVSGVVWSQNGLSGLALGAIWLVKLLPEFVFLRLILGFLGKKNLAPAIVIVQFFYPFYVLFFGLAAQQKGYVWKGRKLR